MEGEELGHLMLKAGVKGGQQLGVEICVVESVNLLDGGSEAKLQVLVF